MSLELTLLPALQGNDPDSDPPGLKARLVRPEPGDHLGARLRLLPCR